MRVPWTIAEKDGRILASHCDCMAGLGETCTHVLWATAAGVERRELPKKVLTGSSLLQSKQYHMPHYLRSDMYKKGYLSLGCRSLLQLANQTNVCLTAHQAKAVESKTRDQAKSRIWFRMRAGRITASKFNCKSACWTDPANPSKSLTMSVCYPEVHQICNEATKWGCQLALEIYSHRSQQCQGVKVWTFY